MKRLLYNIITVFLIEGVIEWKIKSYIYLI